MIITFDADFDGGAWPGPLAGRRAAVGESWVGESGLLGILETSFGLGGLRVPAAERTAAIIPSLRQTPGFWSGSLGANPLATAERLLGLRDSLRMCGWNFQPVTPRLAALAEVTSAAPPGFADRLAEVCALAGRRDSGIAELRLFVPPDALPARWREVISGLERRGTRMVVTALTPAPAKGDLARVREQGFSIEGDGSLTLIRPSGLLQAAEETAAWLASLGDLSSTVVIGADAALDRALRRHGVPVVGAAEPALDDALLQVLPLTLALLWSPPDPQRALELLTLPTGPVPRSVAWRLVRALQQRPAVDSDPWRLALAEGLAAIEEEDRREKISQRLQILLAPGVTTGTCPVSEVRRRLAVLTKWLQGRLALDESHAAHFGRAFAQCQLFERLLHLSGFSEVTAAQLRRFVEEATSSVARMPIWTPEAGLRLVASPGAVCGPVERTVWWRFCAGTAPRERALGLWPEELSALKRAGVEVPARGAVARANAQRWSRPLGQTVSSLLLVCPQRDEDGSEAFPHPAFDEIRARAKSDEDVARLVSRTPPFERPAPKHRPQGLPVPAPSRALHTQVPLEPTEKLSPTSLGDLMACSLKWALQRAGRLYGGATARLPEAENLLGDTAHALMASLLQDSVGGPPKLTPDAAEAKAQSLFDELGPRLAAPLFRPGADVAKSQARRATGQAAKELFRLLQSSGATVRSVEQVQSRAALDGVLEGQPDLVIDLGGRPAVIDLKWGGAKYRRDSLAEGTAHQLAAYARIVAGADEEVPAGYFILQRQRLLFTDAGAMPGAEAVEGPSLRETWKGMEATHRQRRNELRAGQLFAPAIDGGEGAAPVEGSALTEEGLVLEPPCRFCDYTTLCGKAFAARKEAK